jgi:hypothetical protein
MPQAVSVAGRQFEVIANSPTGEKIGLRRQSGADRQGKGRQAGFSGLPTRAANWKIEIRRLDLQSLKIAAESGGFAQSSAS